MQALSNNDTYKKNSDFNDSKALAQHQSISDRVKMLIRYNAELDEKADLTQLNERFLESKLEKLESLLKTFDTIEISTLKRLTELTLLCAGNYANNSCFSEVGDLMVNPRLILVHIKGNSFPVKKERHTPLTIQFKDKGTSRCSVMEWLKHNTLLETVKEPLLPYLVTLLEQNKCTEYVESVKKQMSRIVDVVSHLSTADRPGKRPIRGVNTSPLNDDNAFMEPFFYQFDKRVFNNLGDKIRHSHIIEKSAFFS